MKKLVAVAVLTAASTSLLAAGTVRDANKGNVVEQARHAAVISSKWGPEIQARFGISSSEWVDNMMDTFSAADLGNLRRAAQASSFDGMTGALFGGSSAANRTDTRPMQIGSTENDLVFTPLPPCRIVDTRVAGGPLSANGTRSFNGWTSTDFLTQGGASTNCGIPSNASAIVANVVAVNTTNRVGYLTAYPSNEARPNAATINFVGSDLGNQSVLKLCRPGCPTQFSVFSTSATQVVVDVYGYYMEPVATELDCMVQRETGTLLNLPLTDVHASCPTGYAATGGGCGTALNVGLSGSGPRLDGNRPVGWNCKVAGSLLGGLLGYTVEATCCRVPGR